jgi:hypothetical protein
VPLVSKYHPFYCEENAYHLCVHPALAPREPAALFIRGSDGPCVMWHQKIADEPGEPVLWDYHVVVVTRAPWQIWDPDSTLGCPAPAAEYLRASFRPDLELPPELRPRFRLVDAADLARTFASDRSHMLAADGSYTQPPPPWPPIGAPGSSTLSRYLAVGDPIAGEELGLLALYRRVTDR